MIRDPIIEDPNPATKLGSPDLPVSFACRSGMAFILAGGQSSRMGTDKALALFNGISLIQNAVNILASTGLPTRIAGSRSSLEACAPVVSDTFSDSGPLAGIHAALASSDAEWSLFLPVDLPLMPSSLLTCLLQRAILTAAPVTIARLNGRIEPFPAVLHRTMLPGIESQLRAGRCTVRETWQQAAYGLGSAIDSVAVENLLQCGQCHHPMSLPPCLWFQSANTPADLAYLNRVNSITPRESSHS